MIDGLQREIVFYLGLLGDGQNKRELDLYVKICLKSREVGGFRLTP